MVGRRRERERESLLNFPQFFLIEIAIEENRNKKELVEK